MTESPYAQPLNFVIPIKSPSGGYQKKTIKTKKKNLNKGAVVTPSPNFLNTKNLFYVPVHLLIIPTLDVVAQQK